jgi:hypothetical protein
MKTKPSLPRAYAILFAPERRGRVRVVSVHVVQVYEAMEAASVEELPKFGLFGRLVRAGHVLPFARLCRRSRVRTEMRPKLRAAMSSLDCARVAAPFQPASEPDSSAASSAVA